MQPREYSKGGDIDGMMYVAQPGRPPERPVSLEPRRQPQAQPELVRQQVESQLPLRVRPKFSLFFLPVYRKEVSFSVFFIHPPSILPISFNGSESRMYFLLSNIFNSQAI